MTEFNATDKSADIARWGFNLDNSIELEDWATEWQQVLNGNGVWGGRTRGGRGVQKITGRTKDISVEGITIAFCGKELLQRTSLKLVHQHRYGLIGENGVGKSTLLRRMAKQWVPGIPLHFRFGYVQQELPVMEDISVMNFIMKSTVQTVATLERSIADLQKREMELDDLMETTRDNEKLEQVAEELCEVSEDIEELEAQLVAMRQAEEEAARQPKSAAKKSSIATNPAVTRADLEALGESVVKIFDGLGISKPLKRLSMNMSELSGGWRMRAVLAQALVHLDSIDVLLLDEPTNHLDLPTIAWLQDFLTSQKSDLIVLFVSHDRAFLNTVATDIIEMKDMQLHYFAGSYEDYLRNKEELTARKMNLMDAKARKEAHLIKSIEMSQQRGDDKSIRNKQKKLERANLTRTLDGHKFKMFSASSLDEKGIHMPDAIDGMHEAPKDFRMVKIKFPAVDAATLRLATPTSPILTMEKCAFTYAGRDKAVLENVTLSITLHSRIGIIGRNGKGKSTLMQALHSCIDLTSTATATASTGVVKKSSISVHRPASAASTTAVAPVAPAAKPVSTAPSATVSSSSAAANHSHNNRVELISGTLWKHHNVKIGLVNQHQIDLLSSFLFHTPVTYLQHLLSTHAQAGATNTNKTDLELRAHLGTFGVSGNLALQQIGSLSGGQKARLSFAATCLFHPHLLLLDEPSNHLSMDAIEALISAAREFAGAMIIISHNRYLLGRVCRELWTVNAGAVQVRRPLLSTGTASAASALTASNAADSNEEELAFNRLLDECIREQINQ